MESVKQLDLDSAMEVNEEAAHGLCRSVFSDQPKTHACLRAREHWLSVYGGGGGSCVCVCVRRQRQYGGGVLEGSQMEVARPAERPSVVWRCPASFYPVSVYE